MSVKIQGHDGSWYGVLQPMKRPMDRDQVVIFPTADAFRTWLEANHASANELWVGYYKKSSGKSAMTYAEAVDEALCFGWIDSLGSGIDAEVHAIRFTPRRKGSHWSAVNIEKIAQLTKSGRMHPGGLKAFEERDRQKDAPKP